MSKGITTKEPDPEIVYADIFHHPHHVSTKHPPMSLYDRAAQFAAYKALSGYEDMIGEESRLVDNKIELSADDVAMLNEKLRVIIDEIDQGERPTVKITYFIPDPLKAGGRYETIRETIRRIDTVGQKLILDKKVGVAGSYMEISITDVLEIEGEQS